MKIINKSKITKILNFNLKLIVLSSLLFSQLSLSEIFLYQNDPDNSSINIAQANTSDTWYNTSYLYRKEITINSAKVPNTDQTNFPVLISLTDPALEAFPAGKVRNVSGFDIVFSQDGINKLDHEIESYDAATGTIVMWVKIPVLSYQNNTVIYMYYGNAGVAISQENKTGVWDSNFNMVQHMNQDPSGAGAQILDSTVNLNDGVSGGSMVPGNSVMGQVSKALSFDGNDDYVANTSPAAIVSKAISVWINFTSNLPRIGMILNNSGNYHLLSSGNNGGRFATIPSWDAGAGVETVDTYNNGDWHYVVALRDTNEIYVDGIKVSTQTDVNDYTGVDSNIVEIGRRCSSYGIAALIDEVRISSTARSADWIFTEYANQSSPSTFILPLGTEESYATSYNFIPPSPSSGLVNTPSQDFTITPNGIYTGTITITPSGGGLSAAIAKTFTNSSTPQTFTITPTNAGTVTLTLTNSGGFTNPSPVTYTSISTSASPSNIVQGSTGNAITITGIGTSWTAGTPGIPTFTLNGGTGASITSQTVTDSTHATLTINAGSTAGDLTITDPSTGATTIVSVVPSTSNLITSFNLTTPAVTGIINDTDHTVSLTVPYGTNVTTITPTITVSTGATIFPTSGTSHNFTNPAAYTATAQDGTTTQNYTVTVIVSPSTAGGYISPTQPIIPIQNDRIDISNLPPDIIQIAISRTPDFKDVSWEVFSNEEIKQLDNCPDNLYIKFRNKSGAVSDVIIYTPKATHGTNISNLQDGDIVKIINNPDVYIIKLKNNKQYKRLILGPSVFQSYGHLKWSNVKIIPQDELNRYTISSLVKEATDTIIYELFPNDDTGERREFDTSKTYDADSVYEINKVDRDSYKLVR